MKRKKTIQSRHVAKFQFGDKEMTLKVSEKEIGPIQKTQNLNNSQLP